MKCPWCGYDNWADAKVCGDCERSLRFDVACAACDTANPPQNSFCDACGAALEEAAEAGAATGLGRAVPLAATARLDLFKLLTGTAAAMFVIAALAAALRLVSLTDAPPNVTADEADNLQVVYHILAGTGPGLFGLDWKPAPAFSTHMIAVFMRVFGENIVGMRMASVVLSLFSLIVFYFVARQALSRLAGLAAVFLLGTSLWYLHFSRSGWENVHVALYALLATLSLTLAVKRGSWYLYAATGLFAALGLYGFMSGRAIIVAIVLYLPVALARQSQNRKRVLLGYVLLGVVCLVLFAPQLKTAVDDWAYFNRGVEAVSILNTSDDYRGDSGLPKITAHQVWRAIDAFFLMDSGVSRFGANARFLPVDRAVLDRLTGVLFWLGLLVSFWRLRQTALWWVMLLVLIFSAQVLSTGTPNAARAVVAAPFFFLFVGVGLDWLFRLQLARRLAFRAATVVVLLGIAYINVSGYFDWMDRPEANAARQPAVEVDEFERWQALQMAEAEAGRPGFNVGQWHEMREQDGR